MTIDFVPDLKKYPHIYGAQKSQKLIIFVGAGLSALWGCKRWKEMAIALIESCFSRGAIDYWVRENLLNRYSSSPRKLITIAKNILADKYLNELRRTIEVSSQLKDKLPNLFNNLFDLEAIYITTNIDDHFSSLFHNAKIFYNQSDFHSSILKTGNIIHLHGKINKPESLVLTIDEYVARYQDNNFTKFLEYIFFDDEFIFLFVGYGVDEMELIDFMIEKYTRGTQTLKSFINRYYILLPFFQNEEDLFKYEQLYFDQMNMTVIPFAINAKGYDQLNEVLEIWREEILESSGRDEFYKFSQLIENNL